MLICNSMDFCPPNQTLSTPWYLNGLTPCFNATVTTSILCGLAVLLAVCQCSLYYRHSTILSYRRRSTAHKLYVLHLLVHVLLVLLPIGKLFTSIFYLQNGTCYGYQFIAASFQGLFTCSFIGCM